jgi:hypothetical protein
MKRTNSLFALLAVFLSYSLLTAASCNKEEEPSAYDRLQGRWNFQNRAASSFNHSTNQLIASQTVAGVGGDYAEFRTDGRMYYNIGLLGGADTIGYRLLSDTRLELGIAPNLDTADIATLNATDLALKFIEIRSGTPVTRDELTYNFKK